MAQGSPEAAQIITQVKGALAKPQYRVHLHREATPEVDGLQGVHVEDWGAHRTGARISWQEPGESERRMIVDAGIDSFEVVESDARIVYGIDRTISSDELLRLRAAHHLPDLKIGDAPEERKAEVIGTLRRIAGQL